ncbi:MAG: hypothetical protein M8865_03110 [marine benthic group bacterium]|nr:hypothetical protein [Gemmatimonadota bacterium]
MRVSECRTGSGRRILAAGSVIVATVACGGTVSPEFPAGPRPAVAQDGWSPELEQTSSRPLPPAGFGTLSQDQITIGITAGSLLIKLVPLDEWVIRLTAPDTYQRLNSYKVSRGEEILKRARRSGERGWPRVFLVSFFTRNYEESYEPNDLQIRNQSFIYRPLNIIPITPEFNRVRLRQQETQMALYLFTEDIDLDLPLVALYQEDSEGPQWVGIRSTLDRELATVLSRAAP